MSKLRIIGSLVLIGMLAACAETEDGPNRPEVDQERAFAEWASRRMEREQAEGEIEAGARAFVASGTPTARVTERVEKPVAISIKDPEFRRQFEQSYLSETEVEPGVSLVEREQMLAILDLISAEDLDGAAALIQEKNSPAASAVFDFTLANIRFQQERLEEAADAYKTAVGKFPKFRRAWKNIGLIHVRHGEHKEAIKALSQVIELGGGDALTYGLLGFSYANEENDLAAESAFRMANLLDPKTLDWKMGLARSFFKQRRYADAIALLQALIEVEPDRADLWLLQANAYVGLEQPLKAAENFEIVDRLGGATPDSLSLLGDIYVNGELYDLAVDAYSRSLEMSRTGNIDRFIRAAKVLTARGALDEATRLTGRLEELRGDDLSDAERKDLLKIRARLAVARGSDQEEVKVLEEIVKLDPLDGEALILLGQQAARRDEAERAIFYYERAAGIEAFEADAKVRHAQVLVGQGKYAEALPLLRRAQTIKPRENIQEYLEQVEKVANGR